MRIVFVNLHCNAFFLRPFYLILQKSKLKTFKQKYILDYAIKNKIEILNYINEDGTTAPSWMNKFANNDFGRKMECKFVLHENGIDTSKIKVTSDAKEIKNDDIVIVNYYYKDQMKSLKNKRNYKVVLGQHFISLNYNTDLSKLGVNSFVNEVNITNNEFIRKYFNLNDVDKYVLPFTFQDRFKKKTGINKRKNKALAIGTLSTVKRGGYNEYIKFVGTHWVQPMRREILINKNKLTKYIDSNISYIYDDKTYEIDEDDLSLIKEIKKAYNWFYGWRQTNYLSFDMVDKFNEYKMFVCPEEVVGLPGIGFVEGMACGCAYIGLDHDMYKCLGVVPGVHYISYDGTLDGLTKKIEYYQKNSDELEAIAKAGCLYVRKNFNQRIVAKKFFEYIKIKSKENFENRG